MSRRLKNYGLPATSATIATTSTTIGYQIVPKSGTVKAVYFSAIDALAAHDTNYISFTILNLGQAGSGTADVILATAANTTKITGGAALAANTKRELTVHGTAANLAVVEGDRLKFIATASGTLAGTVTGPNYMVSIDASGA